ncbi:unnamed protein product [Closterium sp. NIES-54]
MRRPVTPQPSAPCHSAAQHTSSPRSSARPVALQPPLPHKHRRPVARHAPYTARAPPPRTRSSYPAAPSQKAVRPTARRPRGPSNAPSSSVSALVATVSEFASSHCLNYAAHLVSGPARSLSIGGALVFPLEVLEFNKQFELGILMAAVPHLYAMLLAPEGDPNALDIPTPRTHAEAISGPWAS